MSAVQRDRVRNYIEKGIGEGATLLTGGAEAPDGLDKGFFVRPTVFSSVTRDMTIAREEIFGPVLAIIPYDTEEEAIDIANDTEYGLAGGVWSADPDRAKAVARRLRTGQVEVNGGGFNPMAPFGGYKQSGNGREFGCLRPGRVPRDQGAAALTRRRGQPMPGPSEVSPASCSPLLTTGSQPELVLDEAEMDLGTVGVGLLADEHVLGTRCTCRGRHARAGCPPGWPWCLRPGGPTARSRGWTRWRRWPPPACRPAWSGVRSPPAATASSTSAKVVRPGAGRPSTWPVWWARLRWKLGRWAMEASSPIRTLVRASSVTSSIMLLATPRAHEAWPAAVIGINPIRNAGDPPRWGVRQNSSKVR